MAAPLILVKGLCSSFLPLPAIGVPNVLFDPATAKGRPSEGQAG